MVSASKAAPVAALLSSTTGKLAGRSRTGRCAPRAGDITMSPSTRPRMDCKAAAMACLSLWEPVVGTHPWHQVIVADHTDGAIGLEHGEPDVFDAGHAVLAQRLQQVVPADAGTARVLFQHGAVIDEHDPLAREPLGDPAAVPAHGVDDRVPA